MKSKLFFLSVLLTGTSFLLMSFAKSTPPAIVNIQLQLPDGIPPQSLYAGISVALSEEQLKVYDNVANDMTNDKGHVQLKLEPGTYYVQAATKIDHDGKEIILMKTEKITVTDGTNNISVRLERMQGM
jgi:hypothetical protein